MIVQSPKVELNDRQYKAVLAIATNRGISTTSGVIASLIADTPEFKELSAPSDSETPSMGSESSKQYHGNQESQE